LYLFLRIVLSGPFLPVTGCPLELEAKVEVHEDVVLNVYNNQ
jgi:hypothetical protein